MQYERLKELRKEYEISQARLAEFMKVKESDIVAWENGSVEPSMSQIERLASLFDIAKEEFIDIKKEVNSKEKKDSQRTSKGKNKTTKKVKNKTKYKKQPKGKKQKVVNKRSNVPLLIGILLLVVGLCAAGGYVYWKYGDEYFIGKKSDTKWVVNDVVGTFSAEDSKGSTPSQLSLKTDKTFVFELHECDETTTLNGTWTLEDKTITLHTGTTTYVFEISSSNALLYQSSQIPCGPSKSTVFTRGATNDGVKEEDSIPITIGTWQDDTTTLSVTSVEKTTLIFSLTAVNPQDNTSVAKLTNITGTWKDGKLYFTFEDDGFSNSGTGTISFTETQAAFTITKTEVNSDAVWSIPDSKVLNKV